MYQTPSRALGVDSSPHVSDLFTAVGTNPGDGLLEPDSLHVRKYPWGRSTAFKLTMDSLDLFSRISEGSWFLLFMMSILSGGALWGLIFSKTALGLSH